MEELKSCPFCGSEPHYRERTERDVHHGEFWPAFVQCGKCQILFRGEDAVERWNKRHDPEAEASAAVLEATKKQGW